MYLKRLDLLGFKSFAARTGFEFGQGITAIVGPNGSGKSNIADALRWVLGEQSSRLLRARKLDDIIYAGSGKRQRSDRVEVSITLDNGGGWLPLDVREVTITRRGARSGDSDYYINGKKTRLRELQTLMIKATATQSSYAIIGQGLVESVLNLRPEERRELIEEAADIARYRLKIEEAEDRLRLTHENVERVRLLMREISPRLGQLERQAQRAGEHARLSRELTQTLRVYYEHQWHRAQESLTVARAGHDQAQAEFTQARVALETCQRELDDVAARLEEQRQAAAASAAERDRLDQRLRELERRLAVAGERRTILEARLRELQEEIEGIQSERASASAIVDGDDGRRKDLEEAVTQAKGVVDGRNAELSALEQEFREARGKAEDADAKAQRLESAAAELKVRAQRLTDGRGEAEREAAKLETRRRSLVNQMAEQVRLLRSLRAQEVQLLAEVSHTAARRQKLEADALRVREQLAAVEANQNARRGKLEGLEARMTVLTEAQEQVGAVQAQDAVTIEGALGTIYEIIRVPRGLEEAIAAALDDQLEAFVFERQAEAIAAIQSLVSQRGPRTSALPLDGMKQVYPLNLMREKGVLGVAARLVKYPAKYERLVNLLLGRTVIVQDVETAVRMLKRGLGTIVTADGVVFHPSGQISGGQPQSGQPFVLAYERDLESIPKEIERIRRSLESTRREAETLREKLREAESALGSLTREAEAALDKRTGIQDALSQRQQRLAQLRGEMRGLVGLQAGARQQEHSVALETERLRQERESLLSEAKECRESARYLERANRLVHERRNELQGAVEEAAAALARVDGELRALAVQREASEAAMARLEAQASAKAVQLRGVQLELTNLQSSAVSDEEQAGQTRAELESLLAQTQPGHEGTHHLEARQRDLHSQVISSQGRLFEAERRALEAETEVVRWQMEVDTLKGKMAEDGMTMSADGDVVVGDAVQARIPFWLVAEGQDEPPGGLRPISGGAQVDPEALGREIERLRGQIRNLGPVNVEAQGDYASLRERHDFLEGQVNDLAGAELSLHRAIEELTNLMERRFQVTFEQVAQGFEQNFHAFFGEGGHARLGLTDPKNPMGTGVDIEARPPGKRTKTLTQLSGGEKALTAVSLLFALLQANPSPFCVLDEVDAMLDEANVGRFAAALKELAQRTQFIVITHNRRTIEVADSIYGISMAPDAASRVLSMRLADVTADLASEN